MAQSTAILVSDIDDCLLRADQRDISITKIVDGDRVRLSTDEYAQDPDRYNDNVEYDFSEFSDPERVRTSIIRATPILQNLAIVDEYMQKGYDFAFLTARHCEDVVAETLYDFLKYRDKGGRLRHLGKRFKRTLSQAVNDEKYTRVYDGLKDWERKGAVLSDLCELYDEVVFIDDDPKNIEGARKLDLSNLRIIQAKSPSLHESWTRLYTRFMERV
jgi:hypothetical protein